MPGPAQAPPEALLVDLDGVPYARVASFDARGGALGVGGRVVKPPPRPQAPPARFRAREEYAAGGDNALIYAGYFRSLPRWADDLDFQFTDVYEQMMLDCHVAACVADLVEPVLAEGVLVRPAVDDRADPDFGLATEIADECEAALGGLGGSGIEEVLDELLTWSLALGHRLAEQTYRDAPGGAWTLKSLKIKGRNAVRMVVDRFMNVVRVLALFPGAGWPVVTLGAVSADDLDRQPNALPPEKFLRLTWRGKEGDPRGRSELRAAYEPWFHKRQMAAELLKHLTQFGSPWAVGKVSPYAEPQEVVDAAGNPTGQVIDPPQRLLNALLRMYSGQALAIASDEEVQLLQSAANVPGFISALERYDQQISRRVLGASRTVQEAKHGSKADSETAQDVTGNRVRHAKRLLGNALTDQVLRPLVLYNRGPDAAERLCPQATLSPTEHQDWGGVAVLAQLKPVLTASQFESVVERFGIPPPTEEEAAAAKRQAEAPPAFGGPSGQVPQPQGGAGQGVDEQQQAAGGGRVPQPSGRGGASPWLAALRGEAGFADFDPAKHPRGEGGKFAKSDWRGQAKKLLGVFQEDYHKSERELIGEIKDRHGAAVADLAEDLRYQWRVSSDSPKGLGMKAYAAARYGVPYSPRRRKNAPADALTEREKEAFDAVVSVTRGRLEKSGLSELTLYRGATLGEGADAGEVSYSGRGLSSWSIKPSGTFMYGADMLTAVVPIDRVAMVFAGGTEVVVIGDVEATANDPEADAGLSAAFAHAPKGGAWVAGRFFTGGQFVPADVAARATPAERAALGAGRPADAAREAVLAHARSWEAPDDALAAAHWDDPAIERVRDALAEAGRDYLETRPGGVKVAKGADNVRRDFRRVGRLAARAVSSYAFRELPPGSPEEAERGLTLRALRGASLWARRGLRLLDALRGQRKGRRGTADFAVRCRLDAARRKFCWDPEASGKRRVKCPPGIQPEGPEGPKGPQDGGGGGGAGGKAAKEPGPTARPAEKPAGEAGPVEAAASLHAHMKAHGAADETLAAFAGHLSKMTVAELRELNEKIGTKAGGARTKADLVARIKERALGKGANNEPGRGRPAGDGGARGGAVGGAPGAGGPVAAEAGRPGAAGAGQGRGAGGEPAGAGAASRVPAAAERVARKLDRYVEFFRKKGAHHAADYLEHLRGHVQTVGADELLARLGESAGEGDGALTQYAGATERVGGFKGGEFLAAYLDRHGIQAMHAGQATVPDARLVAKAPGPGAAEGGGFVPAQDVFADKLDEAKHLPGLEASEDLGEIMGEEVTHLTPDVLEALDARYGVGRWVVKSYGNAAFAGFGIYFPQRVQRLTEDARNAIWAAGENLARYGFELHRDEDGNVQGIRHEGGDVYEYGTGRYNDTIGGDVRHWADLAEQASYDEKGPALPDGGRQFMAQPAFPVVGVSEEQRALGHTGAEGGAGEARVHVVARDGKAEVIPHATWVKGEHFPVVFEDDDTRAMARAARDAVNALPADARDGQVYAPDVIRTPDGYRVIELNPSRVKKSGRVGASGYLGDNPFVIDSYVSHVTGRDPGHVEFVRKLLTARAKRTGGGPHEGQAEAPAAGGVAAGRRPDDDGGDAAGGARAAAGHPGAAGALGGRAHGGLRGPQGVPGHDARREAQRDPAQRAAGSSPETGHAVLSHFGVGSLPEPPPGSQGRWDQPPDVRARHNGRVLEAARRGGMLIQPEKLARVTAAPNVGGLEHDVHLDPEHGRVYKFTKGGHFGQNKDLPEYLERMRLANRMWPESDYRLHGVVQSPFTGDPQAVTSMAYVSGTRPEQSEVDDWFRSRGWESTGAGDFHSWRDPDSGTEVRDTHAGNFVKTAGGLVPIDVDILPGRRAAPDA